MKVLYFKTFTKKYKSRNDKMNESESQRVQKTSINPRDSKIHSTQRFVDIDNGSQGGTHWCAYYAKDNKSYYFYSFGGQLLIV